MEFDDENVNFYMRDNKAYTEDHVCVYNIFIYKVRSTIKEDDILEYFTRFGAVKKMRMVTNNTRNRRKAPKVGFVNFFDAEVAARVLQKTHHKINSQRILIKACDSWHQPHAHNSTDNEPDLNNFDADDEPDINNLGDDDEPDPNNLDGDDDLNAGGEPPSPPREANILILNDDCLAIIAKMLDLHDQVRMARTCRRFSEVVQMCSKVEHKTLSFTKLQDMTLWEIYEFFQLAGPSVETASGEFPMRHRDRLFELFATYCPNVKRISLEYFKVKTNSLRKLVDNMQDIRELKLRECFLNDSALMCIQKLPKLETLVIPENYELTGKYLSELTTLRQLDINGCINIQASHFIDVIKSLKELRTLNIQICERLLGKPFEEMEKHCHKLEELKMSFIEYDKSYACVARLPALKRFELIARNNMVHHSFLKAFAVHMSSQLQFLEISGRNCIDFDKATQISQLSKLTHLILENNEALNDNCLRKFCELEQLEVIVLCHCNSITNSGLLNLMRKCTKLTHIHIQFCSNIDDQFVFDAIEVLRQRQQGQLPNRESKPVVIGVFRTGVNKAIVENPTFQNASSLIELLFCYPYDVYIW